MTILYTLSWVIGGKANAYATFDERIAQQTIQKLQGQGATVYLSQHDHLGEVVTETVKPIILLDLNYTLVANSAESWAKFNSEPNLSLERYRNWLVDLIRDHYVIMVTVRMDNLAEATLKNIHALTDWQPQEHFFKGSKDRFVPAQDFKERVLLNKIQPKHGQNPLRYLALESNANTREMYAKNGVQVIKVPNTPWVTLPNGSPPRQARLI